jgi:CheY-like chemotaxis protein
MAYRILVVEDERLSRLATERLLEKLGYEVVGVGDGIAAVEAGSGGEFDAILMDCQMPRMDGFKATAEIRRHQAGRHRTRTPIIGLSGRVMEGDGEEATARGMDAYLTKPIHLPDLRATLEQWVTGDTGLPGQQSTGDK